MDIFGSQGGKIGVFSADDGMPVLIGIGSLPVGALVTGYAFSQRTSVQFQRALSGRIYKYAFGENMGDAEISGVLPARVCAGADKATAQSVLAYYASRSAGTGGQAITLSFGGTDPVTVGGYLVAVRLGAQAAESAIQQFSLTFSSVPLRKPS